MSRGPGYLQSCILEVLSEEPTGYLPWHRLKDRFPLQVTDFAKGVALDERLAALYGEGGGGGGAKESYELFAWFVKNRVATPEAEKPFLIIYGD